MEMEKSIIVESLNAPPPSIGATAQVRKKRRSGLVILGFLYLITGCSHIGLVENRGLIPAKLMEIQTNGYLQLDNILLYLDINNDEKFSKGIDISIAYRNGTLVLPEVVGSLVNPTTALVRIRPKSPKSRKTYKFRNTADTSFIDVICTQGIAADKTNDAAPSGWHTRFGAGTEASKYTYKPFYHGTAVGVKVASNPTKLPFKLEKKEANGTFDLNQIVFYLDTNKDGSYTAESDIIVEYKDGEKLVLPDMTGNIPENNSAPLLIKDNSPVRYSFISDDGLSYVRLVFANILQASSTTASTQDGWYRRYNQGTEASKYTYSLVPSPIKDVPSTLYVSIDTRDDGGEPENPGGGEPEDPGGGEPENPDDGDPEDPGNSEANLSAGLKIARYAGTSAPIADERVFDMSNIAFYLDVDKSDSYNTDDVIIEYKDGKLILPDLTDKVPKGEYRNVLMKSTLENSLRTYGFKKGNNPVELVLAHYVQAIAPSKKAWYARYFKNNPATYAQMYTSTNEMAISITSKETILPLLSTPTTGQEAPMDKLAFYLDRDNDQEYSASVDNTLEYVAFNGTWNLALPDKVENGITVPEGQYRRVMVKPCEGKTYHFVAIATITDPNNLGGFKSIVLRPDLDSNKTWLLASGVATDIKKSSSFGSNQFYVRIFSAKGDTPVPMPEGKIP